MIDSIQQTMQEAHAFPAQSRRTGASYADPNGLNSTDPMPLLQDRLILSAEEKTYGLYTRESLLENKLPVTALDEDGLDSRIFESDEDQKKAKGPNELDEGDEKMVKQLAMRDQEVRMHEQSHAAAAGKYVRGAPTYNYQRGPDGKMYAIGGSISVDVGREATEAENNQKSMILQAAAMGVADPSAADAMVVAEAGNLMGQGFSAVA